MIIVSSNPDLIPILRQVQDLGILVNNPQFGKMLLDSDIKAEELYSKLPAEERDSVYRDSAKYVAKLLSMPLGSFGNPAVNEYVTSTLLAGYVYARVPEMIAVVKALDAAKPKLVVLHNDVEPATRVLALWAKARGIPCLHIPHAITLVHGDTSPVGSDIHDLVTASHLAAAGPFQAEWFAHREPKLNIRVTGLPQFDRLASLVRNRERAIKLLKLNPARPVIVYMSSWRQDTNLLGCHDGITEACENFLKATKEFPDLQVVIKCHPRGLNTPWHIEAAKQAGVKAVVTDQHLDICLNAADVVVSYGPSNVVLEAASLPGVSLVAIDGFVADSEIITTDAEVEHQKTAILAAMQRGPVNMQNFLTRYLGPHDGHAGDRIVSWIKELHGIST